MNAATAIALANDYSSLLNLLETSEDLTPEMIADDQHLEGVNQGHELPAREDESAEHAAENNDDANDFYHEINACRA